MPLIIAIVLAAGFLHLANKTQKDDLLPIDVDEVEPLPADRTVDLFMPQGAASPRGEATKT